MTYEMVIVGFLLQNKLKRVRFFGILFLIFSNADIQFAKKELVWKSYTTAKTQFTTKRVELID